MASAEGKGGGIERRFRYHVTPMQPLKPMLPIAPQRSAPPGLPSSALRRQGGEARRLRPGQELRFREEVPEQAAAGGRGRKAPPLPRCHTTLSRMKPRLEEEQEEESSAAAAGTSKGECRDERGSGPETFGLKTQSFHCSVPSVDSALGKAGRQAGRLLAHICRRKRAKPSSAFAPRLRQAYPPRPGLSAIHNSCYGANVEELVPPQER